MRQIIVIFAGICLAGGLAMADSLTIKGIPYSSVRVVDAAKCQISYELNGITYPKQISEVSHITLSGRRDFNKAEDAAKAGKYAAAVAAYDEAESNASIDWLKRLIHYRRLAAASAAKMPGQAVKDWLAVVDEAGVSRGSMLLTPTTVAAKGSSENAEAISLLEKRLNAKGAPTFQAKIRDLLAKLYTAQGQAQKASEIEGSAPPAATSDGHSRPEPVGPAIEVSVGRNLPQRLAVAASQIKLGNYDTAAKSVLDVLPRLSNSELPAALMLRGKALKLSYDKGASKDRAKLAEAGLCFMRVAACFDPATDQIPEALYLGASVSKELGNPVGAANAWRFLISKYPTSEWAQRAQAQLSAAGASR